MEEGFIVDMIINKIGDDKCTEKLMELPDRELTLNNAIRVCMQVELTNAHLKSLHDSHTEQHIHQAHSAGSNRGRGRGRVVVRGRGYQETNQYCTRCCRAHGYGECRAYHRYCGTCGEKGHFTRQRCVDTTLKRQVPEDLQGVVDEEIVDEEVVAEASLFSTLEVTITNMIMMMIRTMQTFVNNLINSVI